MRRNDNEIKINNIIIWAKSDDWGQAIASSDNKIWWKEESLAKPKDFELETPDFRIDAYVYGRDAKSKALKLNKLFQDNKTLILEHPDLGRLKVKFTGAGYRFKREENKLDYYSLTIELKKSDNTALNIKIVEVAELESEKLKEVSEKSMLDYLEDFKDKFSIKNLSFYDKLSLVNDLAKISAEVSTLTADNLVGQIINPITGGIELLEASVGSIGSTFQSYLNFGDNLSKKQKYDASMAIATKLITPASDGVGVNDIIEKNKTATTDIIRQTAISTACMVDEETFDHKSEVNKAIKDIQNISEELILETDNKAIQESIFNVANLAICILKKSKALNTKLINIPITLPVSVICYDHKCKEEDFIRLNKITNPAFVSADKTWEIPNV